MGLVRVERLNYEANYAYAPPSEVAYINTEDIQQAYPTEARGSGPFFAVRFRDGKNITCRGDIDQVFREPSGSLVEVAGALSSALLGLMPKFIAGERLDEERLTELYDLRKRLSIDVARAKEQSLVHLADAGGK
jgi:hypothetical protein